MVKENYHKCFQTASLLLSVLVIFFKNLIFRLFTNSFFLILSDPLRVKNFCPYKILQKKNSSNDIIT